MAPGSSAKRAHLACELARNTIIYIYIIALRASAAVPPLICALGADLGAMGPGGGVQRGGFNVRPGRGYAKGRQRHYVEPLPY